jgi:outer membrane protein assembly factor BamB
LQQRRQRGVVVTLGISGTLSCLDAKDGNVLWRKDDVKGAPQFFTSSSPILVDGLVIAQLGGADGAVVAYNLMGDEKWKTPSLGAAYSSPVLLEAGGVKQIVAMTDKELVGLAAADGKVLWRLPFAPSGRMGYNAATPIVDGATVIYTGQGRGTSAVKVEKKGDAFEATKVWSNDKTGSKFSTPVLASGLLFGSSDTGKLFCIDAKTGKDAWTDSVAQGDYGCMLDAGAAILDLNMKGELIVFKPSADKYEELAKIKAAPTATFGCPVIAGNKIFMKDKDTLSMSVLE